MSGSPGVTTSTSTTRHGSVRWSGRSAGPQLRGWYHAGLALLNPALEKVPADDENRESLVFRADALAVHAAFAAVLGHHGIADTESEEALSMARVTGDPESLLLASHLRAQTLLYLGRVPEIPPIVEQAIALAEGPAGSDWETGRFWVAGLKTLEAFALLAAGDVEHARRLLDESRERLEPSGELFYMSWNFGHRARLAMREDRPDDAGGCSPNRRIGGGDSVFSAPCR